MSRIAVTAAIAGLLLAGCAWSPMSPSSSPAGAAQRDGQATDYPEVHRGLLNLKRSSPDDGQAPGVGGPAGGMGGRGGGADR